MSWSSNQSHRSSATELAALLSAKQAERRSQVRGSLLLAAAVLGFGLVRAVLHGGVHQVFGVGWWRLW